MKNSYKTAKGLQVHQLSAKVTSHPFKSIILYTGIRYKNDRHHYSVHFSMFEVLLDCCVNAAVAADAATEGLRPSVEEVPSSGLPQAPG